MRASKLGSTPLGRPTGIALDATGNTLLCDFANHRILKVSEAGEVTVLAGAEQGFSGPLDVEVDRVGNVIVAEAHGHCIRQIAPSGKVTTLCGGTRGSADGTGAAASFDRPAGLAIDASGTIFVADFGNHTIRSVHPKSGSVSTVAGCAGEAGSLDAKCGSARFRGPHGLAYDGRTGDLFVTEVGNHAIRKISGTGMVSTVAGGASQGGTVDGIGPAARFNHPTGVAVDRDGSLVVADFLGNTIRRVTTAGAVSTIAGGPNGFADGVATSALFDGPHGVAVDSEDGRIVLSDSFRVRVLTPSGRVTTLAGEETGGFVLKWRHLGK